MPTAFRVTLKNRPGTLAHVTAALAEKGINLEGSGAETMGDEGRATLLTSDAEATREVLEAHDLPFEEVELLVVVLQDNPGALAQIARRFADAGVNVLSMVQLARATGRSELGFVVDDPKKAEAALGSEH